MADDPRLRLCLPTGNTPAPAYQAFASGGGDLSRSTVFLLDEFVLPLGSAARCDVMIERDLLRHLGQPPARVVMWNTESDLDAECALMEDAINDGGLDLTLLGLGTNGHVGTNEPGTTIDARCSVVVLHPETSEGATRYGAIETPTLGLTLGMGTLLESKEIWLLVTGVHKANILGRAMADEVSDALPATYLRTHQNVTVYADESAASLL